MSDAIVIEQDIKWQPAWLSWVGSTTMCLNALGVECDQADVAGWSGYAFGMTIEPALHPSGPTMISWVKLAEGVMGLGRTVSTFCTWNCHKKDQPTPRSLANVRHVYEMVKMEIEAGRPCVVWGLGPPEFGVVRGIDGDDFLCVKGGPTPERMRFDETNSPGGPYMVGFPTEREVRDDEYRRPLSMAVNLMTSATYQGERAYDIWATELREHRAMTWANAFGAQCWAEARGHAATFVGRLADRAADHRDDLLEAQSHLQTIADAMHEMATLFPWDFQFDHDPVTDTDKIASATDALAKAKAAHGPAASALVRVLDQ